jgi:hypothetical protein
MISRIPYNLSFLHPIAISPQEILRNSLNLRLDISMEESAAYQASSEQNALVKRANFSLGHKRSPDGALLLTTGYQTLIYKLQGLSENLSQSKQLQKDAQAFQDLQKYADFQNVLSRRLCDGLDVDETYSPINPLLLPASDNINGCFSHKQHIHRALPAPLQRPCLSCPVVIPEKMGVDGHHCWERAYAPSLAECGIDQNTFLHFIDTFNETIKVGFSLLS